MNRRLSRRRGVTLIELIVVLAVMGMIATVAGLTMSATPSPAPPADFAARIAALRDSAVATGRPVTAMFIVDGRVGAATAHPDGRVLSELGTVERTTGRVHDGR
jgi:prepilin-type N-terminal cleavage/methylation domain-containing protein